MASVLYNEKFSLVDKEEYDFGKKGTSGRRSPIVGGVTEASVDVETTWKRRNRSVSIK